MHCAFDLPILFLRYFAFHHAITILTLSRQCTVPLTYLLFLRYFACHHATTILTLSTSSLHCPCPSITAEAEVVGAESGVFNFKFDVEHSDDVLGIHPLPISLGFTSDNTLVVAREGLLHTWLIRYSIKEDSREPAPGEQLRGTRCEENVYPRYL
jgi:hypothetical protein